MMLASSISHSTTAVLYVAQNPVIVCKQSTFRLGCVLTLAAVLAGCDAHNSSRTELIGHSSSDGMSIWAPEFILSSRALDIDAIDLVVRVNGEIVQTQRVGDSWEASFEIAAGTEYDLSIIWTDESGLLLAQLNSTQPGVQSSVSQTITAGQYVSSGTSLYDADGDGFSNLEEIEASSDPRDPDSTPDGRRPLPPPVSVELQRILPEDAPRIDGRFDTIWDSARFVDTERNILAIDNILCSVDSTTGCIDGEVEFQWAGMHDDINLYLYIFGESDEPDEIRAATFDSEILFHDDSVELFFDGNNSRGQSYDGVDDTSIIIALLDAGGNDTDPDGENIDDPNGEDLGRIDRGTSDSVPLPEGIRFGTCECPGRYTFEISIPLSSLNITPGQAFGMEVQLNDDDDGGNRDSYWGWFQTSSSDATFFVPAVMGSATLGTEFR